MRALLHQHFCCSILLVYILSLAPAESRRASGSSSGSRSSGSRSSSWGSSRSSGRSSGSRASYSSRVGSSRISHSRYGSNYYRGSGGSEPDTPDFVTQPPYQKPKTYASAKEWLQSPEGRKQFPWMDDRHTRTAGGRLITARPVRKNYELAGRSAVSSSLNRPVIRSNSYIQLTKSSIKPVYSGRYATLDNLADPETASPKQTPLLIGNERFIIGYMLGNILVRDRYRSGTCCFGCGCDYVGPLPPWYYTSYIPYRQRFTTSTIPFNVTYVGEDSTKVANATDKAIDENGTPDESPETEQMLELCVLVRWNMELPFSEVPNMILTFLANDNISGDSILEKSRFLNTFFNTTARSYVRLDPEADAFTISNSYNISECKFNLPKYKSEDSYEILPTTTPEPSFCGMNTFFSQHLDTCRGWKKPEPTRPQEPFFVSLRRLASLYSDQSADGQMLTDLTEAAKRCYPVDEVATPSEDTDSCLDFSITPDQILNLTTQGSLFGNSLVCKKILSPDLMNCSWVDLASKCTLVDLMNLNVFARNFYLCEEPVDSSLMGQLQPPPAITQHQEVDQRLLRLDSKIFQ